MRLSLIKSHKGSLYLVVLGVVVVLGILGSTMITINTTSSRFISDTFTNQLTALYLAEGGIERATWRMRKNLFNAGLGGVEKVALTMFTRGLAVDVDFPPWEWDMLDGKGKAYVNAYIVNDGLAVGDGSIFIKSTGLYSPSKFKSGGDTYTRTVKVTKQYKNAELTGSSPECSLHVKGWNPKAVLWDETLPGDNKPGVSYMKVNYGSMLIGFINAIVGPLIGIKGGLPKSYSLNLVGVGKGHHFQVNNIGLRITNFMDIFKRLDQFGGAIKVFWKCSVDLATSPEKKEMASSFFGQLKSMYGSASLAKNVSTQTDISAMDPAFQSAANRIAGGDDDDILAEKGETATKLAEDQEKMDGQSPNENLTAEQIEQQKAEKEKEKNKEGEGFFEAIRRKVLDMKTFAMNLIQNVRDFGKIITSVKNLFKAFGKGGTWGDKQQVIKNILNSLFVGKIKSDSVLVCGLPIIDIDNILRYTTKADQWIGGVYSNPPPDWMARIPFPKDIGCIFGLPFSKLHNRFLIDFTPIEGVVLKHYYRIYFIPKNAILAILTTIGLAIAILTLGAGSAALTPAIWWQRLGMSIPLLVPWVDYYKRNEGGKGLMGSAKSLSNPKNWNPKNWFKADKNLANKIKSGATNPIKGTRLSTGWMSRVSSAGKQKAQQFVRRVTSKRIQQIALGRGMKHLSNSVLSGDFISWEYFAPIADAYIIYNNQRTERFIGTKEKPIKLDGIIYVNSEITMGGYYKGCGQINGRKNITLIDDLKPLVESSNVILDLFRKNSRCDFSSRGHMIISPRDRNREKIELNGSYYMLKGIKLASGVNPKIKITINGNLVVNYLNSKENEWCLPKHVKVNYDADLKNWPLPALLGIGDEYHISLTKLYSSWEDSGIIEHKKEMKSGEKEWQETTKESVKADDDALNSAMSNSSTDDSL